MGVISKQAAYRLKAFEYVDFWLYVFATSGFVFPTIFLLLDTYDNINPSIYRLGTIKNYASADDFNGLGVTGILFMIFVALVYFRNYVIMHRIDNRRAATHPIYFFVDYNLGGSDHLERFFRALIVLWVLVSTAGALPPVTNGIAYLIELAITNMISRTAYLDMTMIEAIFTYYGFVISILFTLFIIWDLINTTSIGRHIRNNRLNENLSADESQCSGLLAIQCRHALPARFEKISAICSIVAYIQPSPRLRAEGNSHIESSPSLAHRLIDRGYINIAYLISKKFGERALGLAIGIVMTSIVWVQDKEFFPYMLPTLVGLLLGLYIAVVYGDLLDTIKTIACFPFKYFLYPRKQFELL